MTDVYQPTPETIQAIESWKQVLSPIFERHPVLSQVDLIIEGGVGGGRFMPHLIRALFPQAVYIGTDISEEFAQSLGFHGPRLRGTVADSVVRDIIAEHELPTTDREKAMIRANCLDMELVRDLMAKLAKRKVMLVSYNAMGSLQGKEINIWEKKNDGDRLPLNLTTQPDSPYEAMLHLINTEYGAWGSLSMNRGFFELLDSSQAAGWQIEQFDQGLLAIK